MRQIPKTELSPDNGCIIDMKWKLGSLSYHPSAAGKEQTLLDKDVIQLPQLVIYDHIGFGGAYARTHLSFHFIGKFWNDSFAAAKFGEDVYAIVNTSVSYRGFKKTTITLGANNALNHRPPQNGLAGSGYGYDERGVDAIGGNGILLNLRVRREF